MSGLLPTYVELTLPELTLLNGTLLDEPVCKLTLLKGTLWALEVLSCRECLFNDEVVDWSKAFPNITNIYPLLSKHCKQELILLIHGGSYAAS